MKSMTLKGKDSTWNTLFRRKMVIGNNDELYNSMTLKGRDSTWNTLFRRKMVIGNNDELYDPESKRLHVENLVSQENGKW